MTRPSWSIFRISLSPISVVDRNSWSSENGSKLARLLADRLAEAVAAGIDRLPVERRAAIEAVEPVHRQHGAELRRDRHPPLGVEPVGVGGNELVHRPRPPRRAVVRPRSRRRAALAPPRHRSALLRGSACLWRPVGPATHTLRPSFGITWDIMGNRTSSNEGGALLCPEWTNPANTLLGLIFCSCRRLVARRGGGMNSPVVGRIDTRSRYRPLEGHEKAVRALGATLLAVYGSAPRDEARTTAMSMSSWTTIPTRFDLTEAGRHQARPRGAPGCASPTSPYARSCRPEFRQRVEAEAVQALLDPWIGGACTRHSANYSRKSTASRCSSRRCHSTTTSPTGKPSGRRNVPSRSSPRRAGVCRKNCYGEPQHVPWTQDPWHWQCPSP